MSVSSLRSTTAAALALVGAALSAPHVAASPALPAGDWRAVTITGAKATAHVEPHRPAHALDGDACTAWSAGEYPPHAPDALILEIPKVTPVAVGVGVRLGPLVDEPEWRDVPPSSLRIVLVDGAEAHPAVEVMLKADAGWQWFTVPVGGPGDVTAVRLSTGSTGPDGGQRVRSRISEVRLVVEPLDEGSPLPRAERPDDRGCSTVAGADARDPMPPDWRWGWGEPEQVTVTLGAGEASLVAQMDAGQRPKGLGSVVPAAVVERMLADRRAVRRVARTGARRAVRSAARFGVDSTTLESEELGPWGLQAMRLAHLELLPIDVDEARRERRSGDVYHVEHQRSHARVEVKGGVTRVAFETVDGYVELTRDVVRSRLLLTYDAAGRLTSVFRRDTHAYKEPDVTPGEPDTPDSITEHMLMLDIEWRGGQVAGIVRSQVSSGRKVGGERAEFARRHVLPSPEPKPARP